MLGKEIDLHDARVGQVGHVLDPRHRRYAGARADIDEDALCLDQLVPDPDLARPLEARVIVEDGDVPGLAERLLHALGRGLDQRVLARLHAFHVDAHGRLDFYPEIGRAARQMGGPGAGHQRLGRRAASVDAGAAETLAVGDGNLHPGRGQPLRQGRTGLAGADDDGIERPAHEITSPKDHLADRAPKVANRVFSWEREARATVPRADPNTASAWTRRHRKSKAGRFLSSTGYRSKREMRSGGNKVPLAGRTGPTDRARDELP